LALRLLARIVVLAFAVFFTWDSDLDGIGAFLADIWHRGHRPQCRSGFPVWRLTFCWPIAV